MDVVTTYDMTDRDWTGYDATALAAVSAAIREAAGSHITTATATVTVPGSTTAWLDIPGPVRSVASVTVDETVLGATDYRVWPDRLWCRSGWGGPDVPVTITYTLGVDEVPADVVQLACELVMLASGTGATADPRVASEGVDDYRVTYREGGGISAIELPRATRDWLRARFSGGVSTVGSR